PRIVGNRDWWMISVSAVGRDRSARRAIGGSPAGVGVRDTGSIGTGSGAAIDIRMAGAISSLAGGGAAIHIRISGPGSNLGTGGAAIHVRVLGAAAPPMLGAAAIDIGVFGSLAIGVRGAAAPGIGVAGRAGGMHGAAAGPISAGPRYRRC